MPYGYIGATPSQVKFNYGNFSLNDINQLKKTNNFGGTYEHIETITASNQVSIEFTNIQEDKYDLHRLIAHGVSNQSTGRVNARFSTNGGSSYITSGYTRVVTYRNHTGSDTGNYSNNSENAIWYSVGTDNSGNTATSGAYINFYNLGNGSKYKNMIFEHTGNNTNNNTNYMVFGKYQYESAVVVNAIQFFAQSGTQIKKGVFSLYGWKRGV